MRIIRFTCALDPLDGLFNTAVEVSIYRIVQECLNNVLKHSRATAAAVTIKRRAPVIEIAVQDNGKGFSTTAAKAGFGLQMLAERAGMIGGVIVINSTPGQGTNVTISIRIEPPSNEERDSHRDRG